MTPFREKVNGVEAGSYIIDRRFRHIGRIKKSSGTESLDELRQINECLTALSEIPRNDILRSVQDGTYTPREVWQAHRKGKLDTLTSSKTTRALLAPAMTAWAESYPCSDDHRRSLRQAARYVAKIGGKRATIERLPEILEKFRNERTNEGRTFNITRSAAQAFIRDSFKKHHPLWNEISGIAPLPETAKRTSHPLTPDELRELMGRMHPRHADIAWAMACGGMGPKEYWGKWEIQNDRIRIHGTKREGRDRFVPVIDATIKRPTVLYRAFQKAVEKHSGKQTEPYDMRRSFATWMEEAGIPRTRRRLYMGHGAKDVTDLYERRDIERFLKEDAARLRKHVFGSDKKQKLQLVKS